MSDRAELVADVRRTCRTCTRANGAVDFRGRTDLTPQAIRDEVNAHAAKTAVVDGSQPPGRMLLLCRKCSLRCGADDGRGKLFRGAHLGRTDCSMPILRRRAPYFRRETATCSRADRSSLSTGENRRQCGRTTAPYAENTVEAARAAYDTYRCDFVEIDLYVTEDGEVLVMHDSTFERVTDGGAGNIEEMTLVEIRRYQVFAYGHLTRSPCWTISFPPFGTTSCFFFWKSSRRKRNALIGHVRLSKNTAWRDG